MGSWRGCWHVARLLKQDIGDDQTRIFSLALLKSTYSAHVQLCVLNLRDSTRTDLLSLNAQYFFNIGPSCSLSVQLSF